MMNLNKKVIIVSKGVNPNYLKKKYTGNFDFICLIDNYLERKKWEDTLSSSFHMLPIKEVLEKKKDEIRNEFIDFINQMGSKLGKLWPLFSFSEENTFASNLFLDCARLKVIEDLLSRKDVGIIIVVDDPFLLKTVKNITIKREWKTKTKRDFTYYLDRLKVSISPFFHMIRFLLISFKHWNATRGLNTTSDTQKGRSIILHTWIDDGSFTREGQYKDRYFGKLIPWVKEKGLALFIVPFIYNTTRPLREVYNLLVSSGVNFIFPHRYYHLIDYCRCLGRAIKILSYTRKSFFFSNLELKDLVKRDCFRQIGGSLPFLLYLDLFIRLKERGLEFNQSIDVFEGMIPERAWILGFSKAYPQGVKIGYQHTLFSRDLLSYFVYRGLSLQEVLPDKIVCTGEMVKNLLLKEGLPANRLVVGCALRYDYLWKRESRSSLVENRIKDYEGKKVLVSLPLQLSGAAELLSIISRIAGNRPELTFSIKPHPMMKRSTLLETLKNIGWTPDESLIAVGSMEEWIERSDIIVSTASASVVDAIVMGKPVVIVGRECVLDLNPLDWIDSPYTKTYYGEKEIEIRINNLLNLSAEDKVRLQKFGEEVLAGCFNSVTDESLSCFLPI